jgi:hypothetical protein
MPFMQRIFLEFKTHTTCMFFIEEDPAVESHSLITTGNVVVVVHSA